MTCSITVRSSFNLLTAMHLASARYYPAASSMLKLHGWCCYNRRPIIQPKLPTVYPLTVPPSRSMSVSALLSWLRGNKVHESDGIPRTDQLVFSNSNKNYLVMAYSALCLSTVIVGSITGHMYWNYFYAGIFPSTSDIENPMLYATMGNLFGVSLLIVTRYLKSRMFLRMYYNENTNMFTGIKYSWRLSKDKIVFAGGSVKEKVTEPGLSQLRGNYTINGQPYYISTADFKKPVFYNIMMGYVKPSDS